MKTSVKYFGLAVGS